MKKRVGKLKTSEGVEGEVRHEVRSASVALAQTYYNSNRNKEKSRKKPETTETQSRPRLPLSLLTHHGPLCLLANRVKHSDGSSGYRVCMHLCVCVCVRVCALGC